MQQQLDVAIFGGGIAGLWLLDELTRSGCRTVLFEATSLGNGQTVASQGILHGGLKYTLQGLLTDSARQIRNMPAVWCDCLAGRCEPHLSQTSVRADFCHLWRTQTFSSRLGMIGARYGLRVTPKILKPEERPALLKHCSGPVARLDEQIVDPSSLLAALTARHRHQILQLDAASGIEFDCSAPGQVESIRVRNSQTNAWHLWRTSFVVFTAGAGNAGLRRSVQLNAELMQRRPLHMTMLRGKLPLFNGHCVDGAKTRVTITSLIDDSDTIIWQVGGQMAEDGVTMSETELIVHAQQELMAVLPMLDFTQVEWATYRVDRAERTMPTGKRPETVQVICEGNCVTAWPTKLVLVPQLAREVVDRITPLTVADVGTPIVPQNWPAPAVAVPPWETCQQWYRFESDRLVPSSEQKQAA